MSRRNWKVCVLAVAVGAAFWPGRAAAQALPGDASNLPVRMTPTNYLQPAAQPPAPKDAPKTDAPGPKEPPKTDVPTPDASPFQSLTSAALGDTSFASGAPAMIGDFGAILVRRTFFVPNVTTTTTTNTVTITDPEMVFPPKTITTTTTNRTLINVPVTIFVPVAGRDGSGFKIADGATPVPTDRVFFTWNGFDDLRSRSGQTAGSFSSSSMTGLPVEIMGPDAVLIATATKSVQVSTPSLTVSPMGDLNREIFGFEKTFLDGKASVEVRLPIFEGTGNFDGDFNGTHFGDITSVFKYAWLLDPQGLTFSSGMALTVPTGQAIELDTSSYRSVLFQPFVGYLYRFGDVYVQGFNSIVVSTATQDPTLLFNDISVGYRFYNGRSGDPVRSIDAVLEAHLTTPLDHRGESSELIVTDIFSSTAGLHFGVGQRSFLTLGLNGTWTGPRPYGIEGIVNLDIRF
jgi:hypothetical protein